MDRLQMPNTINATNPMPTNSTTSVTESYSSQCRLPESMTFHPCFELTARIGRQLLTRSLGDLLPPSPPADTTILTFWKIACDGRTDQSFFMFVTQMKIAGLIRADPNRSNLPSILTRWSTHFVISVSSPRMAICRHT